MNAYDVKKEMKDAYGVKTKPMRITLPKASYLKIAGTGNPNEKDGAYATAVHLLYGLQYTIKMSMKKQWEIPGYSPFVVAPLEGLWWLENEQTLETAHKDQLHWYSIMRLPAFVTAEVLKEACLRYEQKHPDAVLRSESMGMGRRRLCANTTHRIL